MVKGYFVGFVYNHSDLLVVDVISILQTENNHSVDKTFNVPPSHQNIGSKLNTLQSLHCKDILDDSEDDLCTHFVSRSMFSIEHTYETNNDFRFFIILL